MTFRFIHAADIHLDSPLRGLGSYTESAAQDILNATRPALENMVQLAIDEAVAFVVIAGDLYDGDWKDIQTGLFFVEQMGRLAAASIPVFVLHGNHDAESKMTKSLPLPDNVRTFRANKPETFELHTLSGEPIALHGRSFPKPAVHDNLVPDYPPPVAGHFNIGVLHTALEGNSAHAPYAPCELLELQNKGYGYWALGHVHKFSARSTEPYVVYPGNLQGRNIRESGPKGVCLVTVEDGDVSQLEHIALDVARWSLVRVDVSAEPNFTAVLTHVGRAIRNAVANEADGRLLACRLELIGSSALHGELNARVDDVRVYALGSAEQMTGAGVWIEKVKVRTTPQSDAAELAKRQDALGELFRELPNAADDEEFKAELVAVFAGLKAALPFEVQEDVEDPLLKAMLDDDLETLLLGMREEILSDLTRAGERG